MSRYIDADALHDALKAKQLWVVRCGDKHNEGYTYDQVHFAIDDAPSIDIEPKRGKNLKSDYPSLFECSVCGASCDDTIPWDCDINFCPNCGAEILWNISREKEKERTVNKPIRIVRCKECKRWGTDDCFMCNECQRNPYPTKPDDFCSYGERKESE